MSENNKLVPEDLLLTEVARPQIKEPPMYLVVLLNDDYTPMDFVTAVLQKFFALSEQRAVDIMWKVHTTGKGVCGIFTRDIAETKAVQINTYSRQNQQSLLCSIEPS
jgi:ATP-dependent Clp protease adaptor protein ClpS